MKNYAGKLFSESDYSVKEFKENLQLNIVNYGAAMLSLWYLSILTNNSDSEIAIFQIIYELYAKFLPSDYTNITIIISTLIFASTQIHNESPESKETFHPNFVPDKNITEVPFVDRLELNKDLIQSRMMIKSNLIFGLFLIIVAIIHPFVSFLYHELIAILNISEVSFIFITLVVFSIEFVTVGKFIRFLLLITAYVMFVALALPLLALVIIWLEISNNLIISFILVLLGLLYYILIRRTYRYIKKWAEFHADEC